MAWTSTRRPRRYRCMAASMTSSWLAAARRPRRGVPSVVSAVEGHIPGADDSGATGRSHPPTLWIGPRAHQAVELRGGAPAADGHVLVLGEHDDLGHPTARFLRGEARVV